MNITRSEKSLSSQHTQYKQCRCPIHHLLRIFASIIILPLIYLSSFQTEAAQAKISNKSAKAIEILRLSKEERIARDEARKSQLFQEKATIIRVINNTPDGDIDQHLIPVVENQLKKLGFRIKQYAITKAIVEKKQFKGFNSTEGLEVLGKYLNTNILVFLTIDKCIVSTFADELHDHISSGHLSIPDKEFVEIQLKMSIFDVTAQKVLFTHSDRQFIPLTKNSQCIELQNVFNRALYDCVSNLLITMRPVHWIKAGSNTSLLDNDSNSHRQFQQPLLRANASND